MTIRIINADVMQGLSQLFAEILADYEYRQSKDGRIHACMQKENGEAKLLCAFRPPMM